MLLQTWHQLADCSISDCWRLERHVTDSNESGWLMGRQGRWTLKNATGADSVLCHVAGRHTESCNDLRVTLFLFHFMNQVTVLGRGIWVPNIRVITLPRNILQTCLSQKWIMKRLHTFCHGLCRRSSVLRLTALLRNDRTSLWISLSWFHDTFKYFSRDMF